MSIGRLIDQLARIVANPSSNLTGAMLLLAMVVLVLLILSVGALITILPGPDDEDEGEEEGEGVSRDEVEAPRSQATAPPRPGRAPMPRWLAAGLPAVLLVAAFASAWWVTGTPRSCESCHAIAPSVKSWRSGDHAKVTCVRCHEDGGAGLPAAAIDRVGDVLASVSGRDALDGESRPVPSHRCLRCHSRDLRGTLTVGVIRVSHEEFLERGYECRRCHTGVGHAKAGAPERAVDMNECVGCHDGKTAASDCRTCHVGDPSAAVRVDRAVYPKADIPIPPGCRGCHETESCTKCHGLEMPHPEGFETAKGHASQAAFERKEVCWRCHIARDCRRCHRGAFTSHASNWKSTHPSGVPLDGRNACACHVSPNFCGLCHETGRP